MALALSAITPINLATEPSHDAGVTARPMEREERPTVFDRPTPAPKRSMSAQDRALLDAAAAKRQRRALKRAGSNGAP